MGGSDTAATTTPPGVYGTLGVAAATNVPGGRAAAASWTDGSGNFWLFGGNVNAVNDLWEFNPTSNEWTWESGSDNLATANAIYGTKGTAAVGNVPGIRVYGASWTDNSGNLWLFGGAGRDSVGTTALLNDLWKFNPTSKEWTWVSGSSVARLNPPGDNGQPGVYGTLGTPSVNNVPGGREGLITTWIDNAGNLWLFGGTGFDSTGTYGELNDLWEFNPTAKTWTWVSGSSTANSVGVYGTMGIAAAADVPGGRAGAVGWIDHGGSLWLFGGTGPNATLLNDLWQFDPTTKIWTWMSGSSIPGSTGVYGTQGIPATTNIPAARYDAVSWIDSSGNFWLFGGNAGPGLYTDINDLWKFNPTSKEWTWMTGSSTPGATGVYGTLGVPSSSNVPGARYCAVSWIDGSGNFWLFGGSFDSTTPQETVSGFNDLWRYQP